MQAAVGNTRASSSSRRCAVSSRTRIELQPEVRGTVMVLRRGEAASGALTARMSYASLSFFASTPFAVISFGVAASPRETDCTATQPCLKAECNDWPLAMPP